MSWETYDWRRGAVAEAAADALAEEAETLLRSAERAAAGDPQTLALVGLGLAVLSHRSTVTQLGDDLAADLQDVTAALRRTGRARSWWQRLTGRGAAAAAADDEGQADAPAPHPESLAALAPHPRPRLHVVTSPEEER
jgi:hypothetical protein